MKSINITMNSCETQISFIYGRTTYQLMESYWPTVVKTPTGNKPTDEFATLIDNISKIVFSRTLKNVDWQNTALKKSP